MAFDPNSPLTNIFAGHQNCQNLLSANAKALTCGDLLRLSGFGMQGEALTGAMPNIKKMSMDDLNSIGKAFECLLSAGGTVWKYRPENVFACCTCCT